MGRLSLVRMLCITLILCVLTTANLPLTIAADSEDPGAVVIDGKKLFTIKARVGDFLPEDRARIVTERLLQIADDIMIPIDEVHTKTIDDSIEISVAKTLIMTVTEEEAAAEKMSLQDLTDRRVTVIKEALIQYRAVHSVKTLAINTAIALLLTGLLFWLLRQLNKFALLIRELSITKGIRRYRKQIPGHRLLPLEQIKTFFANFIAVAVGFVRLIILYFYLFFVLGLFPWTKQYSEQLLDTILFFAQGITNTIIEYLPDGLAILFIILVSRYFLKFVRFLFDQIKIGKLHINGFHIEWADPTYKIVRFLVLAITVISIYPYIPGSRSLAFQGVSVFLGVLLSLGSSSAVANIVAGIALTYTRAFQIGDRVRIGENEGDIMEKSLLATRIRTIKNTDITIPNSVILNNPIINYSSSAKDATTALILSARVTLSFSTPQEQAAALLVKAAAETPDILAHPAPFVFKTAFTDFAVEYEINAYTQKPNRKDDIYSALRSNILATFNTAGVEIMTPHYVAVRNGSQVCIPEKKES